jgi:ATP-dependent phosphoenolpyruvate carboxykinase
MPVTIKPSPETVGHNYDATATTASELFHGVAKKWDKDMRTGEQTRGNKPVLHSSFKHFGTRSADAVIPYGNGFVAGVIRGKSYMYELNVRQTLTSYLHSAFQQDLHIVLRPDDAWLAITTQFSFYVSNNAEELRDKFVKHDGKKNLVIVNPAPFFQWDVGMMAGMFIPLMQEHMADRDVQDWLMPKFTTTTDQDMAVSSMVMMATMKEYFSYVMKCKSYKALHDPLSSCTRD